MARVQDGGGGSFGSGFASGVGNIAKSVGSVAKKSTSKKKKSSFSGASKGVSNISKGVKSAAKSAGKGYSSRNSGGYASGSYTKPRPATGSTRSGVVTTTSPPPPVPPKRLSDNEILAGDTVYQGQNASYQKALKDYAAQYAAEQAKYTGEYDATKKQYGLDQKQGQEDLLNDYASRGLAQSGVYADALGDFTNDWNTKYADLDRAKNAYFGDLSTAQQNFNTDQAEQLKNAKQQAIQRYLDSLK